MGPTNNLTYLIQHLSAVIGKQLDHTLQEQLQVGYSQYRILLMLEWNPQVQQQSLATSLGQTEASISRQLKLMKTKGLVAVRSDVNNKRKHITALTPKGMQITEAATAVIRRTFGPELAAMSEDQLTLMIAALNRLHLIVCQPGKPGACDHPMGN